MFRMSEEEKLANIGRLAEEYSLISGELNHVVEKLTKACDAGRRISFGPDKLAVQDGRLLANPQANINQKAVLTGLLNDAEMIEVILERERLQRERADLAERLKKVAPHLLP